MSRPPRLAALLALVCLLFCSVSASAQEPAIPATGQPAETVSADEAARLLAEAIENPDTRAALVAQLREMAAADDQAQTPAQATDQPAAAGSAAEAETSASVEASITAAVAAHTLGLAERVADWAWSTWRAATDFEGMRARLAAVDWTRVLDATLAVGLVVVVTLGFFGLARRLTRRPRAALSAAIARRAATASWARRLVGLAAVLLFDLVLLVIAWGAGYALSLGAGEAGRMDIRQSLFLNAFLIVELVKLGLRLLFAPRISELRFWPMTDARAQIVYRDFAQIAQVLGYGLLLLVPVARMTVSWRFGATVEFCAVLIAALLAISMILRERAPAARALDAWAARDPEGLLGMALALLARIWHLIAIAYVCAIVLVWSSQPVDSLGFVLRATVVSLVAITIGTVLMLSLTRAITDGVTLPEPLSKRLPTLEQRLNTYIPNILAVARFLIFVAVISAILRAWDIFDLPGWLADTRAGQRVTAGVVSASVILLAGAAFWLAASSWIDYRMNPGGGRVASAREQTLLSLLRNGLAIVVAVMTLMLALSAVGVNIAPLLAGAGVVGLAIGFGAQTLVKDIITGAFIQLENAMNAGDTVTAGGVTGTVERLTIRSVSLRDSAGTYYLVPFSSVTSIANFNKDFSYYVSEVVIPRGRDVERVKAIMREAFDDLRASPAGGPITGAFDMQGVANFSDETVTVRARIMTRPGRQWGVGRAYNELVTRKLDAANIEGAPVTAGAATAPSPEEVPTAPSA